MQNLKTEYTNWLLQWEDDLFDQFIHTHKTSVINRVMADWRAVYTERQNTSNSSHIAIVEYLFLYANEPGLPRQFMIDTFGIRSDDLPVRRAQNTIVDNQSDVIAVSPNQLSLFNAWSV